MEDIKKKVKELENRIEKLERNNNPYKNSDNEKFNPYDLSQVAELRKKYEN